MSQPFMTSAQFEQWYADNSGFTVQQLRDSGRVIVRCKCEDENCQGWASLPRDVAEDYMREMPGVHGYRYPRPGE